MGAQVWRRWAVIVVGMCGAAGGRAAAQQAIVSGVVVDSATGAVIPGVQVTLSGAARGVPPAVTATAADGRFILKVAPGTYAMAFQRIGYALSRLDGVRVGGEEVVLRVALRALSVVLEPVVLTASRIEQSSLDAPASTSVLQRAEVEAAVRFTPVDQIAQMPGVDVARKGLMQSEFSVRGTSGVNSGGLLMLTDFRYAGVPSIGFNIPYLLPVSREDVERIEVVRGPGAALYGPGAARGVLHVITRSPLESPGRVVSVTAGERSVVAGSFRFAARLHPRLGVAVSGDYLQGDDWRFTDAGEVSARDAAIARGADPDTLRIGRRDYRLKRAGGEIQLEWRPRDGTDIRTTAGVAQAIDNLDLTAEVGGVQVKDWRYAFLQTRVRSGRLIANAVYNTSDAGGTYLLRTGQPLVDRSRVAALQGQYGAPIGPVDLRYGADLRWTDPRTGTTIDGGYEDDDRVLELGGYLHATAELGSRLQLVGAGRVDHHDRLNDLVFSPRAAIVYRPGREHALRLTYNRAFTSPDPSDLFADIDAGPLTDSLPYFHTRAGSIPQHGFSYNRDCGGLCARSPFNPEGPDKYLSTDAESLWASLVTVIPPLGGVPPPTAGEVSTLLKTLDPVSQRFEQIAPGTIQDLPALRRTITNSVEVGYKGLTAGRLWFTVDVYRNRVTDPLGDRYVVTPNAFFDSTSLANYLGNYMTSAGAEELAARAAAIPIGTITPREAFSPVDLILVRRQGGRYTLWGADLGVKALLGRGWSLAGTYSWVSSDSLADIGRVGDLVLNAPRTKGSASLTFETSRWRIGVTGRAVSSFPVASGQYNGRVTGYGLLDASFEFRLRGARSSLTVDGQNLLDHRHQEIVGAPALGRLVVSRLRLEF